MNDTSKRYHGIAIALHWLIAVLIIGMLAIGKLMISLDESDPQRFDLTQWHKSFGIVILALMVLRLLWRLGHRPPRLPEHMKSWEVQVAGLTHVLLYLLIFLLPISGWIMVSASPLDLSTVLFNRIPFPHLPFFDSLASKAGISALFADIHELAGSALILLLLAHIGAALRHQYVLHDDIMTRMSPKPGGGQWATGFTPLIGVVVFVIAGLIINGYGINRSLPLAAGDSQVSFTFILQGNSTEGVFPESKVDLLLDIDNPNNSSLRAAVNTTGVTAGNSQIDSTLKGSDWFDINSFPQAIFESTQLLPTGEDQYSVSGTLQIRGISKELAFPMQLVFEETHKVAIGSFIINRLDFDLGKSSQPDDDTVGYGVEVSFKFEIQS
jgi:cytochrome b561/polyisoprenoid-binding protein YceI